MSTRAGGATSHEEAPGTSGVGASRMAQSFRIDSAHGLDFIADVMAAEGF
jgi:hypothetical protein